MRNPQSVVAGLLLLFSITTAGCGGRGGGASAPGGTTPMPTPTPAATALSAATITANAAQPGTAMTKDQLGTNLALYFDESASTSLEALLKNDGIGMVRWPGGSVADTYHWQSNTWSNTTALCSPTYSDANTAFDTFMRNLVVPGSFDLNITVNYGSNATCTGGGDPNEAASWVAYSNITQHYGVKYWTVGNEQFFNGNTSNEADLNTPAHSATEYANQVATKFYPLMKAQDPSINVGVDVIGGASVGNNVIAGWDQTVLANARYDFVELHFYPDDDDDEHLLTTAPASLTGVLGATKAELAAAGHASTPIYLGEFDDNAGAGKQTATIVDALFVGMVIGEVTNAGVPMATVYEGVADCPSIGNNSSSIYGWQAFGSFGMYASANSYQRCSTPALTPFPKARAYQVASLYVVPGEKPLPIANSANLVQAYAATHGTGFAFMLFNLDQNNSTTQTIGVRSTPTTSFTATTTTYGKAQYDKSQAGVWSGPVTASLGTVSNPMTITLPPWSMTVVQLAPAAAANT
jgi:hypothetical protein